ncbi:uncharacterized protein DSM5745_03732 [Aspergillus mulundensis]|uniref:NodB homology domain-containing protein n=1 Tax=Aspergillus mulundensis TaxID=1810919 RepID=A0A3D8SLA4_9EURO|nr:hypothetical protein DSM5745_03732 [Aspergillus mulundensis]RDW87090.1 hypothetical protein DSM5745_03732 [Aspergillus mulundensis]
MPVIEEKYSIPRDFEGFGEEGFNPQWPNNARIAISFVLNYVPYLPAPSPHIPTNSTQEEGGERSILDGDAHSEPYLWEKGSSGGYKQNARYLNAEQDFEYGSRSASWRLLRLFKEFNWNFTTYAVAVALQKNPAFARALVRDGHEIAAHGYRWLDIWEYTPEQEREYIVRTLKVLKEVSGEMPVGAYFGRGTPQTHAKFPEIWEEMGEEFLWSSEVYNDDVPYWLDLPWEGTKPEGERKGMLLIPYNFRGGVVRAVSEEHVRHVIPRGREDDEYPAAHEDHWQAGEMRGAEEVHAPKCRPGHAVPPSPKNMNPKSNDATGSLLKQSNLLNPVPNALLLLPDQHPPRKPSPNALDGLALQEALRPRHLLKPQSPPPIPLLQYLHWPNKIQQIKQHTPHRKTQQKPQLIHILAPLPHSLAIPKTPRNPMHRKRHTPSPSRNSPHIPAVIISIHRARLLRIQTGDVEVPAPDKPVVDDHDPARGHQEDRIRAQEREERLRGRDDLPRDAERRKQCAEDLPADDIDVSSSDGGGTHQTRKEHARPRLRPPKPRQNLIVQIPHVPETPPQDLRRDARRRTAHKHHENLANQDPQALRPGRLRRARRIPRHIGLVDEDRTQRAHDAIGRLDHGPDERGAMECHLPIEREIAESAIHPHRPPKNPEQRSSRIHSLDDKQMPQERGMHKHNAELDDPEHEERKQIAAGDPRGQGERVSQIHPGVPEDAAQTHGRDHAAVVRLRGEVDYCDGGAHEHEEARPADSRGRADVHWVADVVAGGAAGVEDYEEREDERAEDCGEEAVPPALAS